MCGVRGDDVRVDGSVPSTPLLLLERAEHLTVLGDSLAAVVKLSGAGLYCCEAMRGPARRRLHGGSARGCNRQAGSCGALAKRCSRNAHCARSSRLPRSQAVNSETSLSVGTILTRC